MNGLNRSTHKVRKAFLGLMLGLTGCSGGESGDFYCLVASQERAAGSGLTSVTFARKYETDRWCQSDRERFAKQGYEAECRKNEVAYEPFFNGEAAGTWYLLQRLGRLPPLVILYEFEPHVPEQAVLYYLKSVAPHAVKFAALHRAPAEVIIFSPKGDVRAREMLPAAA